MTAAERSPLAALVDRVLPRLRYPQLFAVVAVLLLVDALLPDPLPVVDEVLLAALTFLLGSWRSRREPAPPPKDVTPPSDSPALTAGGDDAAERPSPPDDP